MNQPNSPQFEFNNLAPSAPFVLSYAQKLVQRIPLPAWLSHLVLWELIFLGDYLLGKTSSENHVILFGFCLLFFSSICIATMYCTQVLTRFFPHMPLFIDEMEEILKAWYIKKLKMCYEGFLPIAVSIVFAAVAVFTLHPFIDQLSGSNETLTYYRYGYFFVGMIFTGLALWALVMVIMIPVEVAKFTIKVSIYQFSGNGLQALGSTFLKMSLSIVITYALILGAAIFSPYRNELIVVGWMVFAAAMILVFFFLPQINIHKIMTREKSMRLNAFSKHLEAAMENSLRDPSSENMNRLKELFELHQHLNNMHEWPFDTQTLWQLLTALLIPVLLALLEIFF